MFKLSQMSWVLPDSSTIYSAIGVLWQQKNGQTAPISIGMHSTINENQLLRQRNQPYTRNALNIDWTNGQCTVQCGQEPAGPADRKPKQKIHHRAGRFNLSQDKSRPIWSVKPRNERRWTHMRTQTLTHAQTNTHAQINTHAQTNTHSHNYTTHKCTNACTDKHINNYVCTLMQHTHMHMHEHTHSLMYIQMPRHTHTRTDTNMHIYAHIHVHTRAWAHTHTHTHTSSSAQTPTHAPENQHMQQA